MNKLIDVRPVVYSLPAFAIPNYGGGSFITSENLLLMTTRSKLNHSVISVYDFSGYLKAPTSTIPILSTNILDPVLSQLKQSLGQSYPYLYRTHDGYALLFTDWFKRKKSGSISNRLSVAILDHSLKATRILFSRSSSPIFAAGAPRILSYNGYIRLAIPLLCDSKEEGFPDYTMNISKDINTTSALTGVELAETLLSLKETDFTIFKTGRDKTTYLNHITQGPLAGMYIYSARNNNSEYRLYSSYLGIKHYPIRAASQTTLTYPSHFSSNKTDYLLVSTGRYGCNGLYCGRLI
mgnify:CR=1 FL=1